MFMGMIERTEQLELFMEDERINTVGVELIAKTCDTPFNDSSVFTRLHERNLFAFVNALDLGNEQNGLCGYDDTTSIIRGPQYGWGKMLALGVDVIQTDWPEMCSLYRQRIS